MDYFYIYIAAEDVAKKCVDLSSYEGRRLTDGSGNSLYEAVHITEQDYDLIDEYTREAAHMLSANARYVIADLNIEDWDSDHDQRELEFACVSSRLADTAQYSQIMLDFIALFAMYKWLEDKAKDRSEAYKLMADNMMTAFIRQSHKKPKPNLEDY